jgi:hypothetical protein
MTDDRSKAAGEDRRRISLVEDDDVRAWTQTFGVTEAALRRAVARVGDGAEAVQRELGGRR